MSAQVSAMEFVIQAVKSGEISQSAIQASVNRLTGLKSRCFSPSTIERSPASEPATLDSTSARHAGLAKAIFAKSTTLVRSVPGSIPISKDPASKIVFLSPAKPPLPGGAVDSGEEKTREPYTPASYITLLRACNPSVIDVRFYDEKPFTREIEDQIASADTVILVTRDASLRPYQKTLGLSLGAKLGEKLIVIATCDPYDFIDEKDTVKNYMTIYDPPTPAFEAAVDVLFGTSKANGVLPVSVSIHREA